MPGSACSSSSACSAWRRSSSASRPSVWLSVLALIVMGGADMVSVYVRETLIQLWTPDQVRGRVNAVNRVFVGASNELGEFRAGVSACADRHGAGGGDRRARHDRRGGALGSLVPELRRARHLTGGCSPPRGRGWLRRPERGRDGRASRRPLISGSAAASPAGEATRSLDQREAVDVEQAEIGDLQMRDHRQRQEGDLQERLRQRAAERLGGAAAARSAARAPPRTARGSSARRPAAPARRGLSPPAATTKPPCIAMTRLTAAAMSASSTPTTVMLWLSWPTEEAMAPRFRPKPCTKPRPILRFLPCRATTATLIASCARSASASPARAGQVEVEPLGDDAPGRHADHRHRVQPRRDAEIVRADTARASRCRARPARAARALRTARPRRAGRRRSRCATRHSSRSSSSTRSARQPGATRPRSRSPKAFAADQLAAR